MPLDRARRGVVLLAALVVVGVVGILIAAGYYAARVDLAQGEAAVRADQLTADADAALVGLLAGWDSATRFRQPIGNTSALGIPTPTSATAAAAWVTRLTARGYWFSVRLADRTDTALFSTAAMLVEVEAPEFAASGPGVEDPASPGGVPMQAFAATASRTLPAGYLGPAPTANLAYAEGSIVLTGGSGAGVLVVDGTVTLAGPMSFRGVIYAAEGFRGTADGVIVSGLVISGGSDGRNILQNIVLHDDSAAVSATEWHAASWRVVSGGSWAPTR